MATNLTAVVTVNAETSTVNKRVSVYVTVTNASEDTDETVSVVEPMIYQTDGVNPTYASNPIVFTPKAVPETLVPFGESVELFLGEARTFSAGAYTVAATVTTLLSEVFEATPETVTVSNPS